MEFGATTRAIVLALATAILPAPAMSQYPQPTAPESGDAKQPGDIKISHPVWLPAKVTMRYPGKAQYAEKEGRAIVRCTLDSKLKPRQCMVVQEEPAGFGFGEATIQTVMQLQASPASSPGELVEVPLNWRLR